MVALLCCMRRPARSRLPTLERTMEETRSSSLRRVGLQRRIPTRPRAGLPSHAAVPYTSYEGLRVDIAPSRERVTLRAVGEIDLVTAPQVEEPLFELLNSGFRHVVLDLQRVTFMDSSGVRVLITAHRRAEDLDAGLSILVGPSRVRQTLELSGAIDYLAVT